MNNRNDSQRVGAAILIRNDVTSANMNIRLYKSRKLEVQAVKFWSNSNSYILNVNNPYQTASKDEYTFYFKQMGPSGIIVGDFNGYHTMWNDQRQSNSSGSKLVSSLLNFDDYAN